MTEDLKQLRGVGGWLMFFAIAATVFGPIRAFSLLKSEWEVAGSVNNPTISAIVWVETGGTGLASLLGIVAGVTILSRSQHGRSAARLFLWGNIVLSILQAGSVLLIATSAMRDAMMGQVIGGVFGVCIASGLWLWYFNSSKRVRATYGDPHASNQDTGSYSPHENKP